SHDASRPSPSREAEKYTGKEVVSIEEALSGARDIIAELINETEEVRSRLRSLFTREALITSKVVKNKKEAAAKYRDYFEWSEKLRQCPSHRFLALQRGEAEGLLRISAAPDKERAVPLLRSTFLETLGMSTRRPDTHVHRPDTHVHRPEEGEDSPAYHVHAAIEDAYARLLEPSLENEAISAAKEQADDEAIEVFTTNLRQLLLAPPLGRRRVLAVDPGYRTGCKVVCLDRQGSLLFSTTVFPHEPQKRRRETLNTLRDIIHTYGVEAVATGNGTAGRETEKLLSEAVSEATDHSAGPIPVFSVSEDGASVYSASDTAREELPEQDVTVRGAVSIGRRLMDPLSELVKIDPGSLGIGQYQHDVDSKKLQKALDGVVESCVNLVGVDINTAGKSILRYVSGLGPKLAGTLVSYRNENGPFGSREELHAVPGMGPKAFQQSAGFLRISGGDNPLDTSAVHPESYHIVEKMAKDAGSDPAKLMEDKSLRETIDLSSYISEDTGLPTLEDIMEELAKPGRDPRDPLEEFSFREDVLTIDDVEQGMILPGVVTNVTRFGAFVDIGIKQNGLVHISEMADRFVKDPSEVVSLGEKLQVKVLDIDRERSRIALSLKDTAGSPHT
ncbi:MAG: helix-hairpin-helix domain-containing protein, partial [Spirochaetia bacterium]